MQADYPAPPLPLYELALAAASRNPIIAAIALLDLKRYRDSVTNSWQSVRDMVVNAYGRCPQRTIAISGYSLGGIMLRYVIPNLPPQVRAKIARIDLVADPTEQGRVDAAMVHDGAFSARLTDEGIDTWVARRVNFFFSQTRYPSDVVGETHQYCKPYDVVCEANPINFATGIVVESSVHKSYDVAGIGVAAAQSVNSRKSW